MREGSGQANPSVTDIGETVGTILADHSYRTSGRKVVGPGKKHRKEWTDRGENLSGLGKDRPAPKRT